MRAARAWRIGMAFGPGVEVGVLAAPPRRYDVERWWLTSEGAKTVLGELLSLAWTKCCFWPAAPTARPRSAGRCRSRRPEPIHPVRVGRPFNDRSSPVRRTVMPTRRLLLTAPRRCRGQRLRLAAGAAPSARSSTCRSSTAAAARRSRRGSYRGASYVAGRPGDRYAVRLTNRSPGRVLVVLSVDGVNAVSGETAAVGADRLRARAVPVGRDHRLAQELFRSGGVLLHRPARFVRGAHRPARQRRRDRRGGVPRARSRAGAAAGSSPRRRSPRKPAPAAASRPSASAPARGRRRRGAGERSRRRAPDRATRVRCARREEARHRPRRARVFADHARPRSSARARRRPRSSRCATTATPTCSRAASFRARDRCRASPTRSRRSFPIRVE